MFIIGYLIFTNLLVSNILNNHIVRKLIIVEIDAMDAYNFGYLVYFFEKALAISGYLIGVNPFDQPGVEAYKKNMFALLGKPGYESEKEALEKRLL